MNPDDAKLVIRVENTNEDIKFIGWNVEGPKMIRNLEPNGEDLKRIVEIAATFPQPDEVAKVMKFAYGIGALYGYGEGERFGHEMINSLRKEGHLK